MCIQQILIFRIDVLIGNTFLAHKKDNILYQRHYPFFSKLIDCFLSLHNFLFKFYFRTFKLYIFIKKVEQWCHMFWVGKFWPKNHLF